MSRHGEFVLPLTPLLDLYVEDQIGALMLWIYPSCCTPGGHINSFGKNNTVCSNCNQNLGIVECPPRCAYGLDRSERLSVEEWLAMYMNLRPVEVEVSIG